jgi:hypothetical protein
MFNEANIRYRFIPKVVENHTDTHRDRAEVPVSRHYKVLDIPILFGIFIDFDNKSHLAF